MVAAKGPRAPPTAIPLRLPAVDHDVPSTDDTALRTVRVVAELLLRVHARLQVTRCSGCVTRNARWTRFVSTSTPLDPLIHGSMGCYPITYSLSPIPSIAK